MTLKIKRTGAADYGRFIKALFFGEPGAGKTLISSTFPNPLYASAEGGLMSIAERDIPYVEIRSSEDLLGIKNTVSQDAKTRESILGFPVDTVVVDTLDEVQQILVAERLKATKSKTFQQQDWGWLLDQMRGLVRGFRNIPIHVVFTCHLKEVSDDNGKVWNKPALQGSICDGIAGYVDLSLLLQTSLVDEVVEGKHRKVEKRNLLTAPSPKFPFLKDRSGKLPIEMPVNFTDDFDRINDLIFGNIDIKEGVEYDVETPQVDVPEPVPEIEGTVTAKPKSSPKKQSVKVSETKAEPVKVDEETPKPLPENPEKGVKSRNKLPDGIEPVNCGHDTDIYCVDCGNEVETVKRAETSRVRHRRILCDACYHSETAKKKENK